MKDAKLFCKHTKNSNKGYVLIDDYRLGKKWEQFQCGDTDPEAPGSRGLGGLDWGWI